MERMWGNISRLSVERMTKVKTEAKIKMGHAGEREECFPYLHICLIKILTYSINVAFCV